MARIVYATFINGIAGKSGTVVFYRSRQPIFGYMREYVRPKYTAQNEIMGDIMKNLRQIWRSCSEGYKEDMKIYAIKYSHIPIDNNDLRERTRNPFAIFIKMLWNFQEANSESIGLDSLTYNDIKTLFTEITTVSGAVGSGYLPAVSGADLLTTSM